MQGWFSQQADRFMLGVDVSFLPSMLPTLACKTSLEVWLIVVDGAVPETFEVHPQRSNSEFELVDTVDGCEILHQKDGWNMLKPSKSI